MKLQRSLSISLGFMLLSISAVISAPAADLKEPRLTEKDYNHWSFVAPKRPQLPAVKDKSWPRNAIDHFILAKLEAQNLSPMPQAGPRTLIRRVTYDLTGLPPTPEEVEAFVKACEEWEKGKSAEAQRHEGTKGSNPNPESRTPKPAGSAPYTLLVDRLLASPAYGERSAQHWLDVARFSETDGFEHDKVRAGAWKYRDWVIDALNADMPYDKFIRSQIAGDELPDGHDSIATGFLMAGPDFPDLNLQEERRDAKLNEMTATVSQAVMGLTMGCAHCHNHKYDPISQADFYRMRAVFAGTLHPQKDKLFETVVRETSAKPPASFVMLRGDFRRPGPVIEPGFPRVLNREVAGIAPPAADAKSSGRRSALAQWLTRGEHPLTSRVAVNRIWLHHFGRGIVTTPGDFGFMGDSPTHPQLLDWLAVEFARGTVSLEPGAKGQGSEISNPQAAIQNPKSSAWSMKTMHKLIVTSATYMQASGPGDREWDEATRKLASARWAVNKAADPSNASYWRGNRRRLEGEAIRDAMLAASARLNVKRGGPGVMPPLPAEVASTLLKDQWKVSPEVEDHHRRSIYLFARRNLRYPLFEVFDKPDMNVSCSQRPRSITATQSLAMLNSQFSLDTARALAGHVLMNAPAHDAARIAMVYQRSLGRPPNDGEQRQLITFLTEQAALLRKDNRKPDSLAKPEPAVADIDAFTAAAWVDLCLAVLNLNEFIHVD